MENHATRLKELGRRHGLMLSIEPYDLNPAGDLALGGAADVPMCEFWSRGFNTYFSAFEAVSIAHTLGRPIVAAESFTSSGDAWQLYPGALKAQGDWALCAGVNRFVFHRYAHQPWLDRYPGMTFGPYGVHWERTETWWEMASGFHTYLARCQTMLKRGLPVADVLYLDAEGAPNVFRAPASATLNGLPDRRGYNFDACAPGALIERASLKNGRILFPDGMSYRLLVLPRLETMTPAVLRKIKLLVDAGATLIGSPPQKSPSLENYPQCDAEVQTLAAEIWRSERVTGDPPATGPAAGTPSTVAKRDLAAPAPCLDLYPGYEATAQVLAKMNVPPDFESDSDLRYTHRTDSGAEIYFVGNRASAAVSAKCRFRVTGLRPEAWDPLTGQRRALPEFREESGRTTVPLRFEPGQTFFVVFRNGPRASGTNFPELQQASVLSGPWQITFDPKWGGPEGPVNFEALQDWTKRTEDSIHYYSGTAAYWKTFDAPLALSPSTRLYLDLGEVKNLAAVQINGRDLGVVWCAPWRVIVPAGLLKPAGNQLEIKVANLWCNRLIKDASLPDNRRLTRTNWNPYQPTHPLFPSGLLGPVRIIKEQP